MREKLLQAIQKKGDLPPLSSIINRLRVMIEDPNAGINDVVRLIQSDSILSGRLLQLANTVYYSGRDFQVTSLTRAMSRLGLKMALDIAYSVELPRLFSGGSIINQGDFWKCSLARATTASLVAKYLGGSRDQKSYAYLGGLMRNTGVLVFAHLIPEEYAEFF
jgi:HD-like signal output (HDOD) protein